SEPSRFSVGGYHIVNFAKRAWRHLFEDPLDHGSDALKPEFAVKKSRDSDFISGVQRAREGPALFQCFLGKREARKLSHRNFLKLELPQSGPIEGTIVRRYPLRI